MVKIGKRSKNVETLFDTFGKMTEMLIDSGLNYRDGLLVIALLALELQTESDIAEDDFWSVGFSMIMLAKTLKMKSLEEQNNE